MHVEKLQEMNVFLETDQGVSWRAYWSLTKEFVFSAGEGAG